MSIYRGGNIRTDGLIFGYDADIKSSRFYKGEPTVNTYLGPNGWGRYIDYVFDGTNNGYGEGFYSYSQSPCNITYIIDNSDQVFKDSDVQKIFRISSGITHVEYLYIQDMFYNSTGSNMEYPLIFQPEEVRTLSFYYYGTYGERISLNINSTMNYITLYSDDNIGTQNTTSVLIPVITNGWQKISVTFTNTSWEFESQLSTSWITLHQENSPCVLDNNHYWKITAPQIEFKSYSTPFTSYQRLFTDTLVDLTKKSIIDLSNVHFFTDGSGVPFFDGNTYPDNIVTSATNFINRTDSPHSCCVLIKVTYIYSLLSIWGYGDYNGTEFTTGLGIDGGKLCWMYNGRTNVLSSGIDIPVNKWIWVGFSRVGKMNKFYINGELKSVVSGSTIGDKNIIEPSIITIGASISNSLKGAYFNGYISNIYLYDQILSDDDMFNNFNSVKKRYSL